DARFGDDGPGGRLGDAVPGHHGDGRVDELSTPHVDRHPGHAHYATQPLDRVKRPRRRQASCRWKANSACWADGSTVSTRRPTELLVMSSSMKPRVSNRWKYASLVPPPWLEVLPAAPLTTWIVPLVAGVGLSTCSVWSWPASMNCARPSTTSSKNFFT